MTPHLETRHDLTPNEVHAIEDRLCEGNSQATGRHDGQLQRFLHLIKLQMSFDEGGCPRH
jgi:hypothetical protein